MQAEVAGRPRDDGRIPDAEDFRLMNFVSLSGGARGTFAIRWRAPLHGPLQGAFGLYDDDGTPNEKSEMAALTGAWITAEENRDVMAAMPVKGEIGILVIGDSQFHNVSQKGDANEYAESYRGAYRGFFENNIQADFVKLENIDEYEALYLPYPVHLESETAEALIEWVRNGGVLVSEGCPGYWGDAGRVHPNQPGHGLDELFGVRQSSVGLVPDLLAAEGHKVSFRDVRGNISNAAGDALIYRQEYETTPGRDVGTHEDTGGIAIVENHFGEGRTLLIGTFPGSGFMHSGSAEGRRFSRQWRIGPLWISTWS